MPSLSLPPKQALRLLRGGDSALETRIMEADLSPEWPGGKSAALRELWWERFGARAKQVLGQTDRDPDRRLRVGYVSGNFNFHSACTVFAQTVLGHGPEFEVFCYSSDPPAHHDNITEAFQAETFWRDVYTWSDAELAELIRSERIDILVDLSGFTPWNRLPVFAMRPAPVQVNAWGYALPTGFPCFDAFFADPVSLPAEMRVGIERVVDLPCVISHLDRTIFPEPGPLPCLSAAPVFSSFNRPSKIDERTLRLWRRVLDAVHGSRLVLRFGGWTDRQKLMARSYLGGDRVSFPGGSPVLEHVSAYQGVDLALDPLAQSGGVSTMEALWMGVPVLTKPNREMRTRTTAAALTAIGMEQFIAADEDDFVAKAAAWVTECRVELAGLRAGLRERMRESPLCKGYAQAVEAAYRMLWKEWCA